MNKTTIIGLVLGFIAVFVGMAMKGAPLSTLINPAAFLIIILGTIAAVVIAFPTDEIKKTPKLFGILFKEQQLMTERELLTLFVEWAGIARKEGLLALEEKVNQVEDQFLKHGMSMAIDGQTAEVIREVMEDDIEAMEERHALGASIFTQAGTYAPTLGVLGAVVGLIAALGNLSDTDKLGHSIAAAFVATLLGIFTGYVLWHPFANKLKRISKKEARIKRIMIEGVITIQSGVNPKVLEDKILTYVPAKERILLSESNKGE